MRYISLVFFIVIFVCKNQPKYPDGGYPYPESFSVSDTNFYKYPLKRVFTKAEAFGYTYEYLLFRPFNEPNLSLVPLEKETFRLSYGFGKGHGSIIIRINEDSVFIKKGDTGSLYNKDTTMLSQSERRLFFLFRKLYPVDKTDTKSWKKKYLDSLLPIYPQLLDSTYYHYLFNKATVRNSKKFECQSVSFKISRVQFGDLIKEINSSGYWSLPYQVDCDMDIADGNGFTLEANTQKKYNSVSVNIIGCPKAPLIQKVFDKIIEIAKKNKEIDMEY